MRARLLLWTGADLPSVGGVQVYLSRLIPGLLGAGCQVTLVGQGQGETRWAGVPCYRFPFEQALRSRDPGIISALVRQVKELLAREQPDLVHLHTLAASLFFYQRAAQGRLPSLVTLHGGELVGSAPEGLQRTALEEVRAVVCCSQHMRRALSRWCPEQGERARVIYAGLEHQAARALPQTPSLVSCGRLVEVKGFDLALEAFRKAHTEVTGAAYRIAGHGDWEALLRRRLVPGAELVGELSPQAIPDFLAQGRAVVVPSRQEGLGLSAVEAGAVGRPVLGFAVGGLPEVVRHGETGLLFAPGDVEALAGGMRRLMSEPALAEDLGAAAQSRVRHLFAAQRFLDETLGLYSEVLSA